MDVRPLEPHALSGIQALLCRVQNRLCAIPLESVVETMRPLPAEPLAGAPLFVLGLAIIRGAPMPVVDLGRLITDRESPATRFVTVRAGGRLVALAVENVVGVRTIPAVSLGDLPSLLHDTGGTAIAAIGCLDAELLLVLECTRIVPEEWFVSSEVRAA